MATAAMGDSEKAWELFSLINPVNHTTALEAAEKYRAEPYVVAADVYGVTPHTGRGGWTWYTGSAGWMYRLITESLLGLRLEVDRLHFTPRLPTAWESFKMHYRYRETFYHISIARQRPGAAMNEVVVDGVVQPDGTILLKDDRCNHNVELRLQ